MPADLTAIKHLAGDLEAYLGQVGEVFQAFRQQDSGCLSYGVLAGGQRWFVKYSRQAHGIAALRRAEMLYSAVSHPALPRLHNVFRTADGLALVLDWLPGENLYDYTRVRGEAGRHFPDSPHARFRALPVTQILAALDTIYSVHLLLAEKGFIAVDFYDGCILYNFNAGRTSLCDLDEYRPGPFVLEAERLPGSQRFMAPEECQRGAVIDQVTNVFTLGRASLVLLGDGTPSAWTWRGSPALLEVAVKAAQPDRQARYPSVENFVHAWRLAVAKYVSDCGG